MVRDWFVIDRVLLDRVFQPAANYLHEKTGAKPVHIAQAIGSVSILTMLGRCYVKFHSIAFSMDVFNQLILPLLFFFIVTILPDRRNDSGRNIYRLSMLPFRFMFLLLTVHIMNSANPNYVDFLNSLTIPFGFGFLIQPFWSMFLYGLTTFLIWMEFCFMSVDQPPPRKLRVGQTWGMAG